MHDTEQRGRAGGHAERPRAASLSIVAAVMLGLGIGLFCLWGAIVSVWSEGRAVAVSRFSPGFFMMVERPIKFLPLPEGATSLDYYRSHLMFEIAPERHAAALAFYDRHFADKGCKRRVLSDDEMYWSDPEDLVDVVAYFCGESLTDNEYEIRTDKPDPRSSPPGSPAYHYRYTVSYNGAYTDYAKLGPPGGKH